MVCLENVDDIEAVNMERVAIIGAGWAGLSAALHLCEQVEVTIFEAGRQAGGRAASYVHETPLGRVTLDHGQHLLMGAYSETRALWKRLNLKESELVKSQPFYLSMFHKNGDTLCLDAGNGLQRWQRFWAMSASLRGLSIGERWALFRGIWSLWREGFCPEEGSVLRWFEQHHQPERVRALFWTPLVLGALNTPIERASMRVFASVLRDSIFGSADALFYFFTKKSLDELLSCPAIEFFKNHHVSLNFQKRVKNIQFNDNGIFVDGEPFSYVIIAVAPHQLGYILPNFAQPLFQYQAICTVYLQYQQLPKLPKIMCGLAGGVVQFVFDREQLLGERGMISAVISSANELINNDKNVLVEVVAQEIRQHFGGGVPIWSWCVTDKRATFESSVHRSHVDPCIHERVYLAGDYLIESYPATLETAVRSGVHAANSILNHINKK